MCIRNCPVITYDIEVFPNVFHCCCKNTETGQLYKFELSERKRDLISLVYFFMEKNVIFCGYNNKHYDDVIINYIIYHYGILIHKSVEQVCESLYNLSNAVIKATTMEEISKFKKWKYARYFYSMDLLTMQFSSKLRVGLKSMQVTMHYKNVQEYDGDFGAYLPTCEIDKMIAYNVNDVESTEELLNRLKKDVELRLFIQDEYGIDALSMDSVKFGETILAKKYCEATGISMNELKEMRSPMDYIPLKDVIFPFIKYKNPELQAVLEEMKGQIVYSKERKGYEKKLVLSNTVYSIGVGGIHSLNKPKIFRPGPDEYIGHSDVASMYPSLLIKHKLTPRHLGESFLKVYEQIYHERIEAKHSGQKLKNLALKLTLNSVTGKMQQEESWMYDPFNVFRIRINGQLILLMLVDRLLELNCEIVQINTDGVMFIAKKTAKDEIQETVSEVERITQLTFESDNYEAFYQYAVNDYFGVVDGYEQSHDPELIEKRGMFRTEPVLGKGLAPAVIPKAVINYFLTKQSVSEFIRQQTDIHDFLMSQRTDKKFKVRHGDRFVQRINRYYASTNGYSLYKVDKDGKEENMLTKSGVTILNKMDDLPITERHINYNYYISEANKIIADLSYQQLELF